MSNLSATQRVTANRIIEARPFAKIDDMLNVNGIGHKTLERLKPFLVLP
jgi:competence protein ComEA